MPPFKKHIFICTNQRAQNHPRGCCMDRGAQNIRDWFAEEIKKQGLKGVVRVNKAGCLDACEHGPTVVVYPEGIWYQVKTQEAVQQIVEKHIKKGLVVENYQLYKPKL